VVTVEDTMRAWRLERMSHRTVCVWLCCCVPSDEEHRQCREQLAKQKDEYMRRLAAAQIDDDRHAHRPHSSWSHCI
jgi:hypothetical protein